MRRGGEKRRARRHPRAFTPAPGIDEGEYAEQLSLSPTVPAVSENQHRQVITTSPVPKSYRIAVAFAPAGGGKATLAARLERRFEDMVHLEMSRHIRRQPDGRNTPDDEVVPVFQDVFSSCNALGWPMLIDGFPRSMHQAIEFCNQMHEEDLIPDVIVLDYHVTRGVSIDRQVARGIQLRGTGTRADIPDSDDELRALCAHRYDQHQQLRRFIIEHFRDSGIHVVTIDGNRSPAEIEQEVCGHCNWRYLSHRASFIERPAHDTVVRADDTPFGLVRGQDNLLRFASTADA